MKNIFKLICDKIDIPMRYNKEFKYLLLDTNMLFLFIAILDVLAIYYNVGVIKERASITIAAINQGYDGLMDKDYYCKAIGCRYIYQPGVSDLLVDVKTMSIESHTIPPEFIYDDGDLYMPIKNTGELYYVMVSGYIYDIILYSIFIHIIIIILVYRMTNRVLLVERHSYITSLHRQESDLQHNILFNTAANISHEVNSPLLVILSSIKDIQYDLDSLGTPPVANDRRSIKIDAFLDNIREMLDLASISVDQISAALNPLSEYKSVKFSNGNKNIYMLCDTGMKLSKVKHHFFSNIEIDPMLRRYSVYHDNGMTNSFMLNVLLNHINNSVEAGATKITLKLNKVESDYMYLYIIDNGAGVPADVVNTLYDVNITTKADISEYSRGVGLYISRAIMRERYQNDDFFISTTPNNETIFCMKFRCEEFLFERDVPDGENG